ncbi:6-bladed beta-propeller [Acidobacteriota bacterium]
MKKTMLGFTLFVLVVFLHAACVNTVGPRKGEWDFKLKKVWEIDKAGDQVLGHPFSLTATEDGYLYVFDPTNRVNYIFDQDGSFVSAFGKQGQGSGEIQGQGKIHYVDGQVYIPAANGIHVFTRDGDYLKTVGKDDSLMDLRIFLSEEEIISAPQTAVFLPGGKGRITRKNILTGEEAEIAGFSLEDWGIAQSRGQAVDIIAIGFSPLMILGYAENRLYWGMNSSYRIHVTDLNGNKINTFSLNRKSRKVSAQLKRKFFAKPNLSHELTDRIAESMPDEISFFHRIEVHGGLIYVFVPDVDLDSQSARLKQIDIFSSEGEYLYRANIRFEENRNHLFSPLHNLVFQEGHLYAVLTDEEISPRIAKYEIAIPNGN